MSVAPTPPPSEHDRRKLPRYRQTGFDWLAGRWGRPLLGGGVAMAIVVGFLAIRGGEAGEEVNALTGTRRGGWSREEDIVLALVVGGAMTAGLAVMVLAEFVRHWSAIFVALLLGGSFLALRELRDYDATTADVMLALAIAGLALGFAIALFDLGRYRQRSGY